MHAYLNSDVGFAGAGRADDHGQARLHASRNGLQLGGGEANVVASGYVLGKGTARGERVGLHDQRACGGGVCGGLKGWGKTGRRGESKGRQGKGIKSVEQS